MSSDRLSLREVLVMLGRRILFVLIPLVLSLGAAVAAIYWMTPVYEATTTLIITNPTGAPMDYDTLLFNRNLAKTYSELARSRSVAVDAAAQLGLTESVTAFLDRVRVTVVRDTEVISISVSDTDADRAAAAANALAAAFRGQFMAYTSLDLVRVIDTAEPLWEPVRPRPLLYTAVGALVGLSGGVGLASLVDHLFPARVRLKGQDCEGAESPEGEQTELVRLSAQAQPVPATGPARVDLTVLATGPVKVGQTVPAAGPAKVEQTVPATGPAKVEQTVPAARPAKVEQTVPATGPAKVEQAVPAAGPAKVEQTVPATGPAKVEETVPAAGPAKVEQTVPATGPAKVQQTVPATGPAKVQQTVPATGPATHAQNWPADHRVPRRLRQARPVFRVRFRRPDGQGLSESAGGAHG